MFHGFFELKTTHDLFGKLKREFEQLQKAPLNQDIAFNFFITAEHIVDWMYPGRANKTKRQELRDSNLLLKICSHIANGSKHFKAEAERHKSVSNTAIKGFFDPNIFDNDFFDVVRLAIELDGDAAKQYGSSINVTELAKRLVDFWQNFMNSTNNP